MTKLPETQASSAHHLCVYGDPKTGKSTLVSKLAEAGYNLIWVSVDKGHSVLYKLPQAAQERIDLIRLPDTRDFPVGIDTCLKIATGAKLKICDIHGQVDCSHCKRTLNSAWSEVHCRAHDNNTIIVFDNISQVADSAMNFATEGKPDGYKSGYDEFRLQGFLMNKFLTDLQQADFHSICIAHVCETTMEDDAKKLLPWIGSVPFSRQAGKYFDHMIYMNVKNKKHIAGSSTVFDMRAVTGSRTDVVIEKDEGKAPSLVPIMKSIIVRASPVQTASKVIEGVKDSVKELASKAEPKAVFEASLANMITETTSSIVDVINKVTEDQPAISKQEPIVSSASKALAALAAMRK